MSDTCTRCPHSLSKHGAGCTSGWLQDGPECYCPNDYDGKVATDCCLIECAGGRTPTHVDSLGQFYCAEHAAEEGRVYRLRAIADVKNWEAS